VSAATEQHQTAASLLSQKPFNKGFSLVELMVGMAVGLLLSAAAIAVVINVSRTSRELNDTSVQIENGRYAGRMLRDDLAHAGFYGIWTEPPVPEATSTIPNPCLTTMDGDVDDDVDNALPFYIQGYPGASTVPINCLSNYQPNTDVVVIRRAETRAPANLTALEDLDGEAGKVFLQTTSFAQTFATAAEADDDNAAQFTLRKRDGSTPADIRRFVTRIYYIRSYSVSAGDGVPTLTRLELDSIGGSLQTEPLVEGIEDLQIEYGIDDGGATRGAADRFVTTITDTAEWGKVVAVRVHLLARNLDATAGYDNNKTYVLGSDGSDGDYTVTPNDHYKRRAYTFTVRIVNPSIRNKWNT
jgi:type IV pilus assembly protein PilW